MKNGKTFRISQIFKFEGMGILLALAALCVIMAMASPFFLTVDNIFNVLRQFSIYAILAVGQAMIIISGGLDLSVGTNMGLMGVLCALFATTLGLPGIVVFPLVLICGGLFGAVNGLLITRVGMNPFITTLGTQYIARSLSLLITAGYPIWLETGIADLGGGYIGPVPAPVLIMLLITVIAVVFTTRTVAGRNIYAVGSDGRAAKLSGIRTNNVKMMVYILMGVLAGLCGIILAGTLRLAEPTAGLGYEMQAIAAVIIGGTSLSGGKGTILGVVAGAALMGVLRNGMVLLSLSSYWQIMSVGLVIILAVSIDSIKSKRKVV